MVDYHSLPDPVVSTKLHDVLAPLRLHQVQFVPAVVDIRGSSMPYWHVNNYNRISCVDEKRSKLEFDDAHEHVSEIEKLVLDEKVLAETPLERRLYFTLKEDISIYVMHRSIMDVVLSANPVGIRFWPVEEWNDSIEFS